MYFSCGRSYMEFFWGVVLARIIEKGKDLGQDKKLFFVGCVLIVAFVSLMFLEIGEKEPIYYYCTCFLFVTGLVLVLIFSKFDLIRNVASSKLVVYLSKLSFPLYLWNLPALALFALCITWFDLSINVSSVIGWAMAMAINFVLAIGSQAIEDSIKKRRVKLPGHLS